MHEFERVATLKLAPRGAEPGGKSSVFPVPRTRRPHLICHRSLYSHIKSSSMPALEAAAGVFFSLTLSLLSPCLVKQSHTRMTTVWDKISLFATHVIIMAEACSLLSEHPLVSRRQSRMVSTKTIDKFSVFSGYVPFLR